MQETRFSHNRVRGVGLLLAVLAGLLCHAPLSRAQEARKPTVLFDFEQQELGKTWTSAGRLQAARKKLPEAAEGEGVLPVGQGVEIRAPARGILATQLGRVPKDWRRYETIEFWSYRSPEEARRAATSIIEVQLAEADGQARYLRRVDLSHQGWKRHTLELRWFRSAGGRVARWDRVERLQFFFRDVANLWLDAIALHEGKDERSSLPSAAELGELAFPGAGKDKARVKQTEDVLLLTDAPDLNLEQLATHLGKVTQAVYRDLPFLEKPATPPCLIVFKTREEYQAFTPRFVERLSGMAAPPQSGGYTIQGVATSSWDPLQGTLRPVYAHEFVHALLEQAALLPNRNEWLQEGLANRYQLQFYPQRNFPQMVATGLNDESQRSPLRVLCNGERIANERYWQAATVADMLVGTDPYRKHLPELLAALQKSGSADLGPQMAAVFKTDWTAFETAWRAHCRKAYAAGK